MKTFDTFLVEYFGTVPQEGSNFDQDLQLAITLNPDLNRIRAAAEAYAEQFKPGQKRLADLLEKLEEKLDGDADIDSIGEFVMNEFDLWR